MFRSFILSELRDEETVAVFAIDYSHDDKLLNKVGLQ